MQRQTETGLIENSHLLAVAGGASLLAVIVLAGLALQGFGAPSAPAPRVLPTAVEYRGGDTDGDGVPNSRDAFPLDATERADFDLDGRGDNADSDDDQDGWPDGRDPRPRGGVVVSGKFYVDLDNDGKPNTHPTAAKADADDDNDGISDVKDSRPLDTDNDGIVDYKDPDRDGDGKNDWEEMAKLAFYKAREKGIALPLNKIQSFSNVPRAVLASLHDNIQRVAYDSDNDGLPNQNDPVNNLLVDRLRSDEARYGQYDARWETHYVRLATAGAHSDWVLPATGAAGQRGDFQPPTFEVHDASLWRDRYSSQAGSQSDSGAGESGGTRDPYHDFYQHREGQEYEWYKVVPPPPPTTENSSGTPGAPPPAYQYQPPPDFHSEPPPPEGAPHPPPGDTH